MTEKKGLSHEAYGGINGENYIPYIPVEKAMPELTVVSIVIGCIFACIFGAANTYLGLRIGMTIAAAIPGAILATGILKGIFQRNNILESNMIASMSSMGESLAGGLIFVIPAIILFGDKLSILTVLIVSILGSLLGIIFVIPIRKYLTVEEHGHLMYPEGMAASEVLVSASAGGTGFRTMMTGLCGGGLYKLLSEGFTFWNYEASWDIKGISTVFGADVTAALVGVGYIVGIDIGLYMFAGGIVGFLVLVPLIKFLGANLGMALYPSTDPISKMDAIAIWSKYVRYIGAGAVIAGGVISIIKAMPTIVKSFRSAIRGIQLKAGLKRTDTDLPIYWVLVGAIFVFVLAWVLPNISLHWVGSLLVVLLSFFFAIVSARLVGIIGTSNNPISGMTISSLLVITACLKLAGYADKKAMIAAVIAGTIVCIATAIAGGAAQSLKTTFIVGGTPKKLEIGMFIGAILSSVVSGYVIILLSKAYTIGSKDLAAPQANMMKMVIEGIMNAKLPWTLIIIGIFLGIMAELMKIQVLPFALGLYLPIYLSGGVVIGGILRVLVDHKFRKTPNQLKMQTGKGILLGSGLVAGDALIGILISVFALFNSLYPFTKFWMITKVGPTLFGKVFGEAFATTFTASPWPGTVMVILLCIWAYRLIIKIDSKVKEN